MLRWLTYRPLLSALAGLCLLTILTSFLSRAYHRARHARAESHFELGQKLAAEGRNEEAVDEYRAALSFSTTDARYRLSLALALLNLDRLDNAEAHLAQLRVQDPTNAVVNLALGRIAARHGNLNEAILDYHRAIYGMWPDQPDRSRISTRFELIDLLRANHKNKEVLAELLELAGEAPHDPAVQKRIGRLLLASGAPRNAADVLQAVLDESPKDAEAYTALGEARFALGDYTGAQSAFQHAQRFNPQDERARKRAEECSLIISLDPTAPKLNWVQRYARSREILSRVIDVLVLCMDQNGKTAPPEVSGLIQESRALLAAKPSRHREGDTPKALTLAQHLWQYQPGLCAAPDSASEPLALLIARVSKD